MHLLATLATPGYDAWKTAFDARAADRTGLTLLQLWRHVDAPDTVTALFEVHDRKGAAAWADRERRLSGATVTLQYVKTA
jgi:hypothetical protein